MGSPPHALSRDGQSALTSWNWSYHSVNNFPFTLQYRQIRAHMASKPRRLELYPHRGDKPISNYLNRFNGLRRENHNRLHTYMRRTTLVTIFRISSRPHENCGASYTQTSYLETQQTHTNTHTHTHTNTHTQQTNTHKHNKHTHTHTHLAPKTLWTFVRTRISGRDVLIQFLSHNHCLPQYVRN
jgi:hypothetical protein